MTDWQPENYLNAADLTRIEGNIEWLSGYLMSHGYDIQTFEHDEWDITGIPRTSDLKQICDEITELTAKYYAPEGFEDRDISDIPVEPLDYNAVNYWERCLLLIKEMIDSGKSYNTHQALSGLAHKQLAAYQHEKVRTNGRIVGGL